MRWTKTQETSAAEVHKADEQWQQQLTREQYQVLRRGHTERPFTGKYVHNQADGSYSCAWLRR